MKLTEKQVEIIHKTFSDISPAITFNVRCENNVIILEFLPLSPEVLNAEQSQLFIKLLTHNIRLLICNNCKEEDIDWSGFNTKVAVDNDINVFQIHIKRHYLTEASWMEMNYKHYVIQTFYTKFLNWED